MRTIELDVLEVGPRVALSLGTENTLSNPLAVIAERFRGRAGRPNRKDRK